MPAGPATEREVLGSRDGGNSPTQHSFSGEGVIAQQDIALEATVPNMQSEKQACCSEVSVGLAYQGPDTDGQVVIVPSKVLAPPWGNTGPPVLRSDGGGTLGVVLAPPTPLRSHVEVANSWDAASAQMVEWLQDEIYAEQVHSITMHSVGHEGHYLGCCQICVLYDESRQFGTRLRNLQHRLWVYKNESLKEEKGILEEAVEVLCGRDDGKQHIETKCLAVCTATDVVYDELQMKTVVPNVLAAFYYTSQEEDPPEGEGEAGVSNTPTTTVRSAISTDETASVRFAIGEAASAQEVAEALRDHMYAKGLRQQDLLGCSIHPIRAAGAAVLSNPDLEERLEWLIFYRGQAESRNGERPIMPRIETMWREGGSRALTAVKCEIWQTQKSWAWHVDQLQRCGSLNSQSLVAQCTTSLVYQGRSCCLQLALWQQAERGELEDLRCCLPIRRTSTWCDPNATVVV